MKHARLLLLTACSLAPACGGGEPRSSAPDVVVVVIDTLRAQDLPPYGAETEVAPFLDELAQTSVVFEHAWSASSWTAPATASIFTSLHPNEHGVTRGLLAQRNAGVIEVNRIPSSLQTLPVFFQELGYETFGVSANINIDAEMGFARGFDRFKCLQESEGIDAGDVERVVRGWLPELQEEGPSFLYLHFMDPHEPYRRHPEYMDPAEPPAVHVALDHPAYKSEIRNVDEHLRSILGALELGPEAILLVTADHGQEFLEHGGVGHRFTLYDELTRVPLLLRVGDDGPRGRSSANVSNMDILPTLRELLGAPASRLDRGRSLLGVIEEAERGSRTLFAMRTSHPPTGTTRLRSIVRGPHKLIHNQVTDERLLFDLASDPGEQDDIAAQSPQVVAELIEMLDLQDEIADAGGLEEMGTRHLSEQQIQHLQDIGYVGEDE